MIVGCTVACPAVGAGRGEMIAFDVAAITFLLSCAPLFRHGPREMRRLAEMNDAHRGILLLIAAAVIGVIMTAIGNELCGGPHRLDKKSAVLRWSGGLSKEAAVKPPSIPGLNRRSGRIPALPYPPIKHFDCTASAIAVKQKASILVTTAVNPGGLGAEPPSWKVTLFLLDLCGNRSAGV